MHDSFDRHFSFFKVVWVAGFVLSLAVMGFLGWVIVKILQHFKIV